MTHEIAGTRYNSAARTRGHQLVRPHRHRTGRRVAAATALFVAPAAIAADPLELKQTIKLDGKAGNPDHLAVGVKGERLFVANKPNSTLDVIDLRTGKRVKQIADQGKASGVAYPEEFDRVYVGNGAAPATPSTARGTNSRSRPRWRRRTT